MTPVAATTGASRCLGRAIALRIAQDGHRVAVGHHRDERAAAADAAASLLGREASYATGAAIRVSGRC